MNSFTPPLKYPGGKLRFAAKIHQHAPKNHASRVILFGGGLGEFWGWKHRGVNEIVNDLDKRLINLYRVIRSPLLFPEFVRQVSLVPFGREPWNEADSYDFSVLEVDPTSTELQICAAVHIFVLIRQSLGGRQDSFTPLSRVRTRRGMNEHASSWLTAVEGLDRVHERLSRVAFECQDASSIIRQLDHKEQFFYADPPYLDSDGEPIPMYRHQMTVKEHEAFLDACVESEGRFLISNYDNPIYSKRLQGWRRAAFDVKEQTSHGCTKGSRQEVLWWNYD